MSITALSDFFSNIKDKLTNPFFGTLIIVWLTRNWEVVYAIFNFDKNSKLGDKILFINNYFAQKSFWAELSINVGLAVLFMIIGYILIVVTRSLSIIVEHNIMPSITDRLINKDVVLKIDYDSVAKERDEYFNKFEEERDRVRRFSKDYEDKSNAFDQLKTQNTQLENEVADNHENLKKGIEEKRNLDYKIIDLQERNSQLHKNNTIAEEELNFYQKNYEFSKSILSENTNLTRDLVLNSEIIHSIVEEIISKNLIRKFVRAMNYYSKGGSISGETINELSEIKLLINRANANESPSIYAHLIYNYIFTNDSTLDPEKNINIDILKKNITNKL